MPIQKPRKGEKKSDFVQRCMGSEIMKKDFPDNDQRLAVCFDSFRTNEEGETSNGMIILRAETGKARNEKFNGADHVVIPVIALVEGVLQSANSSQPELALASEFGKAPKGWNGRPVTVDHPEIKGQKVSANSPEVLETEQIGQLFHTAVSDKKLKTEAWINLARVRELGGEIETSIQRVLDGEVVEVSTGLFADVEPSEGKHEGEKFSGVWRNVVPDHLAILSAGNVGACSVRDGCGTNRVNQDGSGKKDGNKVASDPSKADDGNGTEPVSFLDRIKDFLSLRSNKELSHRTVHNAIEAALGQEERFSFVIDVFEEHFIEEKEGGLFKRNFSIAEDGTITLGEESIPVRFEAGFVELKMNEDEHMDKDKFVTELIANDASQFEEDDKDWLMALEEKQLEKLAPGDGGSASETFNVSVEGEVKTFDAEALQEEIKKNGPLVFGEMKVEKKIEPKTNEAPKTAEDYIASAPPEIQTILNSGLRAHKSRRVELITAIKASPRNKFTDEALEAMELDGLENLALLATPDDYSARAPAFNTQEDPNAIPAPPAVFDLSPSKAN